MQMRPDEPHSSTSSPSSPSSSLHSSLTMDGIRFILEDPQAANSRQKKRSRLVTACDTWYTSPSDICASRHLIFFVHLVLFILVVRRRSSATNLRAQQSARHADSLRARAGFVIVNGTMLNDREAYPRRARTSTHPIAMMHSPSLNLLDLVSGAPLFPR